MSPQRTSSGVIRVMIVDDSALIRAAFSRLVEEDPGLTLFGVAIDPFDAAEKMADSMPDVLLLDLELPRMDGLTFLRKIMAQSPLPVVVCSSHSRKGSDVMLRALELGAAEVLAKPDLSSPERWADAARQIGHALRAAVQSGRSRRKRAGGVRVFGRPVDGDATPRMPQVQPASAIHSAPGEKRSADAVLAGQPPRAAPPSDPLVAIGASTGGTEALRRLISALPANGPPILIVQHMPREFTGAFADRLNTLSQMTVREAIDGHVLRRGEVLVAPGDHHMLLHRRGSGYRVEVMQGPHVCRHRPSVDVLFRSVAQAAAQNALGILLTGMGDDGAAGLGEMRAAGARTLAQDEESSVVFGMPREALRRGAAMAALPLDSMAQEIITWGVGAGARG